MGSVRICDFKAFSWYEGGGLYCGKRFELLGEGEGVVPL